MSHELESESDKRPPDLAKTLHDRARSAGTEYHRLLISLATGVLAAYFIALTAKVEPPLSTVERALAITGLWTYERAGRVRPSPGGAVGWKQILEQKTQGDPLLTVPLPADVM